jgi:hypothetical protein
MSGIVRPAMPGRARVLARAALILAAAAAVLAAGGPTRAAAQSEVSATWDVVGVGANGRSLDLVFLTGGCLSPTANTSAAETATSVTITVTLLDQSGPGKACPAFVRFATTSVALSAPLAGRAILGRPTPPLSGYPGELVNSGGGAQVRVPRLIGFDPADALHTLKLLGLRERISRGIRRHGLVRVTAQTPLAGSVVVPRTWVRVAISAAAS